MELEQRVVNAVMSLDEPYRDVILMRFWEDLGSSEIAERLGISPTAARARLWRGIHRIRASLDQRNTDRGDWRHGLATTYGASMSTLPRPLIWSWLMSTSAVATAAVLVTRHRRRVRVASDRAHARSRRRPPGDDLRIHPTGRAARPDRPRRTGRRAARRAPVTSPTPSTSPAVATDASGPGRVRVRTVDPNGEPLGNVSTCFLSDTRYAHRYFTETADYRLTPGRYSVALRAFGYEDLRAAWHRDRAGANSPTSAPSP